MAMDTTILEEENKIISNYKRKLLGNYNCYQVVFGSQKFIYALKKNEYCEK